MKEGGLVLAGRHLGVLEGTQVLFQDLFDTIVLVADERSLFHATLKLSPDLVIVDLAISEKSDLCLAERLLESHSSLRLVILSVYEDISVAHRVIAAGAKGYVVRRAIGTDILPAVYAAMAGRSFVSPLVYAENDELKRLENQLAIQSGDD
ncbi:response regulator [Pirellulaceae bacterium SH467]